MRVVGWRLDEPKMPLSREQARQLANVLVDANAMLLSELDDHKDEEQLCAGSFNSDCRFCPKHRLLNATKRIRSALPWPSLPPAFQMGLAQSILRPLRDEEEWLEIIEADDCMLESVLNWLAGGPLYLESSIQFIDSQCEMNDFYETVDLLGSMVFVLTLARAALLTLLRRNSPQLASMPCAELWKRCCAACGNESLEAPLDVETLRQRLNVSGSKVDDRSVDSLLSFIGSSKKKRKPKKHSPPQKATPARKRNRNQSSSPEPSSKEETPEVADVVVVVPPESPPPPAAPKKALRKAKRRAQKKAKRAERTREDSESIFKQIYDVVDAEVEAFTERLASIEPKEKLSLPPSAFQALKELCVK
jgi:hypothetical protein